MNYQEIEQWLNEHYIKNYTIHENLVVDVDGDVDLANCELTNIPVSFNSVTGGFYCEKNHLISLHNSPLTVGKHFYCYKNKITSLQYSPRTVGGDLHFDNNKVESLQYFPDSIGSQIVGHLNKLRLTTQTEQSWALAIAKHESVYFLLPNPTPAITALFKMLWEV